MATTKFNPSLLIKHGVENITDYAYKMYDLKIAKEEDIVKEMAFDLSDTEARVISDELTTLLYYDALDEGIPESQLIIDFYLDRGPE